MPQRRPLSQPDTSWQRGMHSTVRSALDIAVGGGEYGTSVILAGCELASPNPERPHTVQLYLSAGDFLLFVPEPDDIWRISASMDTAPKNTASELWQSICASRLGPGRPGNTRIAESMWPSSFHIHHRLAKQDRKGRILLVGVVAHVHSPAGRQAMNVGIFKTEESTRLHY